MNLNGVNNKPKKIGISNIYTQNEQNFEICKVSSNEINGIKSDGNLNKDDIIRKLKIENISLKNKNSELENIISELKSQLNEAYQIIELNNISNKNKENNISIYDNQLISKCNLEMIQSNFILKKITSVK